MYRNNYYTYFVSASISQSLLCQLNHTLLDLILKLLPSIILWNPFPSVFPPNSIKCPSCGCATKFSYWNVMNSKTHRHIDSVCNDITLLVSAVYKCDHGHKLLAHDECVQSMVPHILLSLSRTGFTSHFIKMCSSLIVHGINFYKMETLLLERRWYSYVTKLKAQNFYESITAKKQLGLSEFWSSPLSSSPSNDNVS